MAVVAIDLSVTPERRKTHYVSGFALPLFNSERKDERTSLIIALAKEALVHIGRSCRLSLRQNIRLMLGDRYLHAGNAHDAWKTFLSAAFYGDPRLDGVVRHELACGYEALGQNRRAYSSCQRAAEDLTRAPPNIKDSARAGRRAPPGASRHLLHQHEATRHAIPRWRFGQRSGGSYSNRPSRAVALTQPRHGEVLPDLIESARLRKHDAARAEQEAARADAAQRRRVAELEERLAQRGTLPRHLGFK